VLYLILIVLPSLTLSAAKPFTIPKQLVYEAFKAVKANAGAAGVDGQSIEDFEQFLGALDGMPAPLFGAGEGLLGVPMQAVGELLIGFYVFAGFFLFALVFLGTILTSNFDFADFLLKFVSVTKRACYFANGLDALSRAMVSVLNVQRYYQNVLTSTTRAPHRFNY
jgi:hypothetical protein